MQSLGSADYFQCIWCRSSIFIFTIKHFAWSSTPTIKTSEFEKRLFFKNKVMVPKLFHYTQQLISHKIMRIQQSKWFEWITSSISYLYMIHMTQLEFILLTYDSKKQGFLYSIFVSVCSVTTSCSFSSNTLLLTLHILYNHTDSIPDIPRERRKEKGITI